MKLLLLATLAIQLAFVAACPDQDPLCLQCFSSICLKCANSYVNQNGKCVRPNALIANCLSYASDKVCLECAYGYQVAADGNCLQITSTANCLQVDANGECSVCSKYQLVSFKGCSDSNRCNIRNCAFCSYRYGLEICEYCHAGFSVFNNLDGSTRCLPNYPALTNCRVAKYQDFTKCAICHYGNSNLNGYCIPANQTQGLNFNLDYKSAMINLAFGTVVSALISFAF